MIETHFVTSSIEYCSRGPVTVSHPHFIQIVQDDQVVGEVNAKFDFSGLPSQYQILALQLLRGHRIALPSSKQQEALNLEESRPWWKFW